MAALTVGNDGRKGMMKMAVGRADLRRAVRKAAHISDRQAGLAVDTMIRTMAEAIANGEVVRLRGLGTFELRERKPRRGYNFQTGTVGETCGFAVIFFQPCESLRDSVKAIKPNAGTSTDSTGSDDGDEAE